MEKFCLPNGPIVGFRPCTDEDMAFLKEVYASTREEEMAIVPWDENQKKTFLDMQFNAQHTHYHNHFPDASYLIIEIDGVPGGRIYIAGTEEEILIIDISLIPAYRRKGIGTSLLLKILGEGAESGRPVRIHVEKFNPAMRLYERLGFSPVADSGVHLLMEWRK